jgi:Na+-transporting methylmalonyl-CoA/oxaloacetate decarboxylase gamma subunit
MTIIEALAMALLGFSLVFLGLVLIIGFIHVFNKVAKHIKWEAGHAHDTRHQTQPKAETPAKPEPEPVAANQAIVPPTPEILAAIAAAIEIEQRLNPGIGNQKLTIRR